MRALPLMLLAVVTGCAPEAAIGPELIEGRRVLAVRAEPAEARPGQPVTFAALVVDARGPVMDVGPTWAFCLQPKPPTEDNVVDAACLEDAGLQPIGIGPMVTATLPPDGCRLFGPQSPGPGLRPRDADITGGFYQPVRLVNDGVVAVALQRITCELAQAPLAVAQDFAERYVPNVNPTLDALVAEPASDDSERVRLVATVADDAAERYVRFDAGSRALVEADEALTVSWFVTGGMLDRATSPVEQGQAEALWTPDAGQAAHVFAVVRDTRAGVDYATLQWSP